MGHQGLCYHSMGGQVNQDRTHQIVPSVVHRIANPQRGPQAKVSISESYESLHQLPPQIQVSYCTGDFYFRRWPPLCSLNSGGEKEIQSISRYMNNSSTRTRGGALSGEALAPAIRENVPSTLLRQVPCESYRVQACCSASNGILQFVIT